MPDTEVLLSLGGNMGDVPSTMDAAIARLGERCGRVVCVSRSHITDPVGFLDDRPFLNKAVLLRTALPALELLKVCLDVERELGRDRSEVRERPGPRRIDIDLLLYGNAVAKGPDLELPHPRMTQRYFALAPAADVAPGMVHPSTGLTILELLGRLPHPLP